jgi:hypothetical protein
MKVSQFCLLLIMSMFLVSLSATAQPLTKSKPEPIKLSKDKVKQLKAQKLKLNKTPQKPTGPAPEITCSKTVHDFGTAAQGEEIQHIFTVKNKGKGILKIERARGG